MSATAATRHDLYQLFLSDDSRSPTRWYLQNAEGLPARLKRNIEERMRPIPSATGTVTYGWLFPGPAGEEIVRLRDVRWDTAPNLTTAFDNEQSLTRTLALTFEITDATGRVTEVTKNIGNVPFPTPWGTYVIGANSSYLASKLTNKDGIFPVNLTESGAPKPEANGILFHCSSASVLQTEDRIVALVRSLTTNSLSNSFGRNVPVIIPRAAWPELDAAMQDARVRSTRPIDMANYPQLAAEFMRACRFPPETMRGAFAFDHWVRELAFAKIPPGSWTQRLDRLEASDLNKQKFWSLRASAMCDKLRERLSQDEFIPFSSMARMRVETAADIIAAMLGQMVSDRVMDKTIDRRMNVPRGSALPAEKLLTQMWQTANWNVTEDLLRVVRMGSDGANESLANEPTPAETVLRVLQLNRWGHIFGEPTGISDAQRTYHAPSSFFFLNALTMENGNVGFSVFPLSVTEIDPATGEMRAPFVIREGGEERRVMLTIEEVEILEESLAARGLGIAYGRPSETPDETMNLHYRAQTITEAPKSEIPAYFDVSPRDTLSVPLAMLPGVENTEPARHPLVLAFMNGAASCNGSRPDPEFVGHAREISQSVLNAGKAFKSPVSGTVQRIERDKRTSVVYILDENGTEHAVTFPSEMANAYSNATGLTCVKLPGEAVQRGEYLIVPDQACVLNSVKEGAPGVFATVPIEHAAQCSLGEEDTLVISQALAASGALTVLKSVNAVSISGENGPIQLVVTQPGTLILPGDVLAWQKVPNKQGGFDQVPIRADESDAGVLMNIQFFPDKAGRGTTVEPHAAANMLKPDYETIRREILQAVITDFAKIADGWDPAFVAAWNERNSDVRANYESVSYMVWDAAGSMWNTRNLSLNDLRGGKGNPGYDQLVADLARPPSEVLYGVYEPNPDSAAPGKFVKNSIEERLHYTHQMLQRVAERLERPPEIDGAKIGIRRVLFTVMRELPISNGDKLALGGTKGSTMVVHPQRMPTHQDVTKTDLAGPQETPIDAAARKHAQSLSLEYQAANVEAFKSASGAVGVYVVGGRVSGKEISHDSDIDIVVIKPTKFPSTLEGMDEKNAAMQQINELAWRHLGKNVHVIEHFANEAPANGIPFGTPINFLRGFPITPETRVPLVPAQLAYTMHGLLARGAKGDIEQANSGPAAGVHRCLMMDPYRGPLEVAVPFGRYRALRQASANSTPEGAASARGIPEHHLDLSQRNAGHDVHGRSSDGQKGNAPDQLAADLVGARRSNFLGPRRTETLTREFLAGIRETMPVRDVGTVWTPQAPAPLEIQTPIPAQPGLTPDLA